MRIMAITIENIVNYYIKKVTINKKNASKRFASCVQNIIPYFLLSDMGAIHPIILTLSLLINVSVFMHAYTKAGHVGSNNTVQPNSGV